MNPNVNIIRNRSEIDKEQAKSRQKTFKVEVHMFVFVYEKSDVYLLVRIYK